jgi:hypothetical protein
MSLIFNPAFISRRLPHVKTPTTWNPSDKASGVTLSNGNLTAATPGSGGSGVRSAVGVSSGKWYWEYLINSAGTGNATIVGVADATMNIAGGDLVGFSASSYGYRGSNGQKYNNSVGGTYGSTFTTLDVVSVLLDMDATSKTLRFWMNGVDQGLAFGSVGSGPFYASIGDISSTAAVQITANFGQSPFVYQRPWDYWGGLGAV